MSAQALALALAAAATLGCAGGCRGAAGDPFDYYQGQVYKPFFVRSPLASEILETRRPVGRESQSFPLRKAPGSLRVFIVGGSIAQTLDALDFRPRLTEALEKVLPGRTADVLNCGMSGYDAEREERVFDEVLGYSPDLVVLMSGANEWNTPLLPRWLAWTCSGPVRRACAAGLGRYQGVRRRIWSPQERQADFERTVRRMARKAKTRGVSMVLCTVPMSLRDMPPMGRLPLEDGNFFSGWRRFEAGSWREAAEEFRTYVERCPGDAMGHYYLARALDLSGAVGQAREQYLGAQDDDRSIPLMNEALRRVARDQGVALADLAALFESAAPDGLPGRALFEDDVHWDRRFDPLVDLAIAKAFTRAAGRPMDAGGARWLARNEAAQLRAARRAKVTREKSWEIFRIRMWEPLQTPGNLFSERIVALLETVRMTAPGLVAEPAAMKEWLRARLTGNIWGEDGERRLDAWWPAMLGHVGELHRRQRRPALAVRFFEEALRLDPSLEKVRLHRALALAASGDMERARAEFQGLSSLKDDVVTRRWRGAYGL